MCNLYRMSKSTAELARWFDAANQANGANFGDEVYPGYPGAVVANSSVRQMVWGFPLVLKSKRTGEPLKPKPVNNARTDKLDSYMWRHSFAERRCLIPISAWAEAEGAKGGKTRTWLSLPSSELFACAGIWRPSEEWGDCFSMVMTDSAGDAALVHARMPVILGPDDYSTWTGGTVDDALDLCRPYNASLVIDRTSDKWSR